MKKNALGAFVALSLSVIPSIQAAYAQDKSQSIQIISSTWDRPFVVITPLTYLSIIDTEQGIFGVSTDQAILDALNKGTQGIEDMAKKFGAEAVINTSKQMTLVPGRGKVGTILFFGTAVKSKPEQK